MRWCPITLRASLSDSYTASGVYLVDAPSKQEFCLTLSTNLAYRLKSYDNRGIGAIDVSLDSVVWENLELVSELPLTAVNQELAKYVREFEILPAADVTLLIFKFQEQDTGKFAARLANATQALNFVTAEPRNPIVVTASPFAAAHMSLFHGYTTNGVISLVRQSLMFADARYLDGMEGGCVGIPNIGSVGLVAGSLAKRNGEGKLLIIVPWHGLALPISSKFTAVNRVPTLTPRYIGNDLQVRQARPPGGVVAIQIRVKPNLVSWGSGVLVARNLVLTNNHVINDFAPEKIEAHIDHVVRYAKQVHRPIKSLDLVVVELSSAFPNEYNPIVLADANAETGSRVHAVGYGLFSPHRYGEVPMPLQSEGILSNSVKGMLMCTASCWNGSSGGALLNSEGELIGIMASNAKNNTSNEIMPDIAMSIPVSYVKQALKRLVEDQPVPAETDDQLQKVWKLDTTHSDVTQPPKSKL